MRLINRALVASLAALLLAAVLLTTTKAVAQDSAARTIAQTEELLVVRQEIRRVMREISRHEDLLADVVHESEHGASGPHSERVNRLENEVVDAETALLDMRKRRRFTERHPDVIAGVATCAELHRLLQAEVGIGRRELERARARNASAVASSRQQIDALQGELDRLVTVQTLLTDEASALPPVETPEECELSPMPPEPPVVEAPPPAPPVVAPTVVEPPVIAIPTPLPAPMPAPAAEDDELEQLRTEVTRLSGQLSTSIDNLRRDGGIAALLLAGAGAVGLWFLGRSSRLRSLLAPFREYLPEQLQSQLDTLTKQPAPVSSAAPTAPPPAQPPPNAAEPAAPAPSAAPTASAAPATPAATPTPPAAVAAPAATAAAAAAPRALPEAVVLSSTAAPAATKTAVLAGRVEGRDGPVKGARVLLAVSSRPRGRTGPGTARTTTNADGEFEFTVAPGTEYIVDVTLGDQALRVDSVSLAPGERRELNVSLPGAPRSRDA